MTRKDLKEMAMRYAHDELKNNHAPVEVIVAAAFLNGIDYNEHHRWISVDDELPQCNIPYSNWDSSATDIMESERVIALIDNGEMCVATFNQNIDVETKNPAGEPYWFDEGRTEDGGWIDGKVTHWVPLPAAPGSSEIPNNHTIDTACPKEGGEE